MASQALKQRIKTDPEITPKKNNTSINRSKREKRTAMAKRALGSLILAVSLPVSLTLLTIYLSSSPGYGPISARPLWFPPLWAVNLISMASSFLMGLSAWLVWAEGGFHKKPVALSLYLVYVGLSLIWYGLVFGASDVRVGLVACLGKFVALLGCSLVFKEVNPIAGDLVKPCLACSCFLLVVNFRLVSLYSDVVV